jgi:retron-type reverse transcriptase
MEFIRIRIGDTTPLNLLEKFLKAGYVDDGIRVTPDVGTPQGSILSPMVANIFLHYVLDTWFETTVKSHVRSGERCIIALTNTLWSCTRRKAGPSVSGDLKE